MRLFLSVLVIFIVASQLFAARTLTGITGAVTQPYARTTKGFTVNAALNIGSARQMTPFFFTKEWDNLVFSEDDADTFSDIMDEKQESFLLGLSYGGSRFEGGVTVTKTENLDGGGLHAKYRVFEVFDAQVALGLDYTFLGYPLLWTLDSYMVVDYPVTEKLTASVNYATTNITAVYLKDTPYLINGHTLETHTLGLAASYEYDDKLDLAADFMLGKKTGNVFGVEAEYSVTDNFSATAGLVTSSNVSVFTGIDWTF